MVTAGTNKTKLSVQDLLVRGALSGALLGFATTLAFTATIQTGAGIVGALVFPASFVMIVLLGLELVTGNFAVVPLALLERRAGFAGLAKNWSWVFAGNLIGALIYALLFVAATKSSAPIAQRLVDLAEAKTVGYQNEGARGMLELFAKAMLCNWMVTMGVVMALTSTSTAGKIIAMWLPLTTFFAQGFEHSVVNMFVIPVGMLFGADVSVGQWWLWNQIPVTLGNIAGGVLFTGLALYITHGRRAQEAAPAIHVEERAPLPEGAIAS
jgi:formate/nitrite transporter